MSSREEEYLPLPVPRAVEVEIIPIREVSGLRDAKSAPKARALEDGLLSDRMMRPGKMIAQRRAIMPHSEPAWS